MIDFTSSLYLGLRHPSQSLEPWSQLTTGKPAALGAPARAGAIAEALAELQGCERATLLPSTLHLFFDLFEVLRHDGIRIYVDDGAYPMARWGAERAAAQGARLQPIPHYDGEAARRIIARDRASGLRPVVVADGFCAICGRAAPLRHYLHGVGAEDGYVVLDDTQALGIWGDTPSPRDPYGIGGGGSLRRHATASPRVIVGSSLAKGFGVPMAALAGSDRIVRRFERHSQTRVHASPPSIAELHAAEAALRINAAQGDELRRRLARRVAYFRRKLRRLGLRSPRSLFPVQALAVDRPADAAQLHQLLLTAGVRTAVVRACTGTGDRLVFVLGASHGIDDIDGAARALAAALDR